MIASLTGNSAKFVLIQNIVSFVSKKPLIPDAASHLLTPCFPTCTECAHIYVLHVHVSGIHYTFVMKLYTLLVTKAAGGAWQCTGGSCPGSRCCGAGPAVGQEALRHAQSGRSATWCSEYSLYMRGSMCCAWTCTSCDSQSCVCVCLPCLYSIVT